MSASPESRPGSHRAFTWLLDGAYLVAGAASIPFSALRGRLGRTSEHLRRRAFRAPPHREGTRPCLWLHAVSVGEVLTIRRLVERLRETLSGWDLAISSTTEAGVEAAKKHYPEHLVFSCPLDLSRHVRRTLNAIRPDAIAIVEHDIWPNMVRLAHDRGIPVALLNARLSPGSLAGYRRLSRIYPWPPRDLELIAVQDGDSLQAFRDLGFTDEQLTQTGNLKFDNPPLVTENLRSELGYSTEDWILLAGSTHEGEEEAVLDAFLAVRSRDDQARLILVPRRIERSPEIARLVETRGLECHLWTERRDGAPAVLLVDAVGELARLSSVGDLTFVGGSLADIGGHNVIEPAAFGCPTIIGPNYRNFRSIVATFLADDALIVVPDAAALEREVTALWQDRRRARALGERARLCVAQNSGADERTLEALVELTRGIETT